MEMNPDPLSAGVSVILFKVATIDRRFCLVSGLPSHDRCTLVGVNFGQTSLHGWYQAAKHAVVAPSPCPEMSG